MVKNSRVISFFEKRGFATKEAAVKWMQSKEIKKYHPYFVTQHPVDKDWMCGIQKDTGWIF